VVSVGIVEARRFVRGLEQFFLIRGVGREKRGPFSLIENGINIFAPPTASGKLLLAGRR
jgi:hypothetical protein